MVVPGQGRDLYRKLQVDADSGFARTSASVSDATTYTLDHAVTMNSVKRNVEHLENKLDKITEMWLDKERNIGRKSMFSELEIAMKTVNICNPLYSTSWCLKFMFICLLLGCGVDLGTC